MCPSAEPAENSPDYGPNHIVLEEGQPVSSYSPNGNFISRRAGQVKGPSRYIVTHEQGYNDAWVYARPRIRENTPGNRFIIAATHRAEVGQPAWTQNIYDFWARPAVFPDDPTKPNFNRYDNLHTGGGNLLFGDGHAENKKGIDIVAGDFGLTGGVTSGSAGNAYTSYKRGGSGVMYLSVFDVGGDD